MTAEQRGTVSGARSQLAVSLAGLLAEHGVADLTLTSGGKRAALPARKTDLPALLTGAPAGATLTAPGTTITLTPTGLAYLTTNPALAQSLDRLAL